MPAGLPARRAAAASSAWASWKDRPLVVKGHPQRDRQIDRTDDERIDALNGEDFVDIGDRLGRFNQRDEYHQVVYLREVLVSAQPILSRPVRSETANANRRIAAGARAFGGLVSGV